jgi:bacterioferritin-associated ferredoxin
MALICHCNVVRERTIVKAIRRGADSVAELKAATGAATCCGGCEASLCRLLEQHAPASVAVGGIVAGQA